MPASPVPERELSEPWPEPDERVAAVLRAAAVAARIEQFEQGTPTCTFASAQSTSSPFIQILSVSCTATRSFGLGRGAMQSTRGL